MKAFLYTTILTLLSLTAALSCSADKTVHSDTTSEYTVSEHLDSLITSLNHLIYIGEHDSVIFKARPTMEDALRDHDTLTAVYAGLFMAQSYLFLEDMDSVKYCTDRLSPLLDYPLPPNAHIMLSNILGSYSLRTSLDYSKALNHYIEGLSWTEHEERINNRIALLSNIVNIFYVQKSPEGMKFAEEAYRLAMNDPGASGYIKSGANITMAQMLFVQHNYEEALTYLENAGLYAEQSKSMSFYAFINSMFAQIWQNRKDLANADTYYRKAVEYIGYADPGTASQIYLLYGDFLSDTGDKTGAADMYRKGLDISETSGNIEYRQDLLGRIAALTYEAGKYSESAGYSVRYIYYSDSINSIREAEFQSMITSRQQTEAENMLMTKELERQKANERFLKLLFILIIVIILAGFVLMMFQRQRKMYRELVKKHQEYLSKLDRKSSAGTDKDNSRRELFDRIEDLMRNGKIYRRNNISREMLAEQLDTNQNYISKAINTYAGMSFNRYVDSFRIEEATRQISQSPDNILFKQLADDLGYNSVTVFSKAFLREIGCSPSIYRKEILNSK